MNLKVFLHLNVSQEISGIFWGGQRRKCLTYFCADSPLAAGEMETFGGLSLPALHIKLQRFLSLTTHSQFDLGMDFDWAAAAHKYALIWTVPF